MIPAVKSPTRLNVQAKILVLFLSLALISLVITVFYAFSAIGRIGTFAQASSHSLGEEAASTSSNALQTMRLIAENA